MSEEYEDRISRKDVPVSLEILERIRDKNGIEKSEKGTRKEWRTVHRKGKTFKQRFRVGTKEDTGYQIDFLKEEQRKKNILDKVSDPDIKFKYVDDGTISDKKYEILHAGYQYLGKYSDYLDGKSYHLMSNTIDSLVGSAANGIGEISARDFCDIVKKSIDDLVYQELESWERQLGDHGIRHIYGNINVLNKIFDEINRRVPDTITDKDRFNGVLTMIFHDLGYTCERSRSSIEGTKYHKEDGMKLFEHNRNKFEKFLGKDFDKVKGYILNHDTPDIDWDRDPVLSSISCADNLALFYREKLPKLFRDVPQSIELLTKMQKALKDKDDKKFDQYKQILYDNIDKTNFPEYTKYLLKKAAREVSPYTPKVTLSMLVGEIDKISFEKENGLEVAIKYNEFESKLSKLYDQGQSKFVKLAESFGVNDFDKTSFEFKRGNKTILKVYKTGKFVKIEINLTKLERGLRREKVPVHRKSGITYEYRRVGRREAPDTTRYTVPPGQEKEKKGDG